MKHIYKLFTLLAVSLSCLSLNAQSDTTLTKQVILEREYTPSLQTATRINSTPNIYEYTVKARDTKFVLKAPSLSFSHNKLGVIGSGDIGTEILHNRRRAYLQAGTGSNGNIEADAGLRIIDTQKDRLNFYASYDASNGNVTFPDKEKLEIEKTKAKRSDIKLNLNYSHIFEPITLNIELSYFNSGYNYYGNRFTPANPNFIVLPTYNTDTKQRLDIISGKIGIVSNTREGKDSPFNYSGSLEYSNFKQKHGLYTNEDGNKGGIIKLNADFNTELISDGFLGGRLYLMNQKLSNTPSLLEDISKKSFSNITLNPYFQFQGLNWDIELGAKLSALFDNSNKFFLAPNIKANLYINEANVLYAHITGGVNDNTVLDILAENRYAHPSNRVRYSKTQFDIELGFKSGIISGLELDIFGGYKNTKNEHLYIASSALYTLPVAFPSEWTNTSIPAYAELNTGHFGTMATMNLIPYTKLSARVVGYFYSVKDPELSDIDLSNVKKKAWGKPNFTIDIDAEIKPIEPLTISVNYHLAGARKAYLLGESVSMKDINELSAKADYKFTDWLTVYARVNNFLNKKYDVVHGYTFQGINFLGGVQVKF